MVIGHIVDENHTWHKASEKFKELAEEKSGGRLKITIYPNNTLGSEVEVIQSILTNGGCDITFTGESMQTYAEELGIIGMPYAITSDEHMEAVLEGEVGKELEDLKSFIIRTSQSPMTVAAFEAMGAKPTPMAFGEVFTSLQQVVTECAAQMQTYEHELFLEEEAALEQEMKDKGMEFVEVDQAPFVEKAIAGVEGVLSDNQKALYEKIKAAL